MESILGNSRRPDVTFYSDGRIDITSRVAKMLQLEEGDAVDIGVHEGEYYLYIRNRHSCIVGKHEAQCFASKKNSFNYRTYSKKLCSAILRAINAPMGRIPAGEAIEIPHVGTAVPLIIRLNLV